MRRQGLALYEGVSAKKAEPSLRPLLEDKDRSVAASAARILYQGGDKKMLEWLVVASWNSKSAVEKRRVREGAGDSCCWRTTSARSFFARQAW